MISSSVNRSPANIQNADFLKKVKKTDYLKNDNAKDTVELQNQKQSKKNKIIKGLLITAGVLIICPAVYKKKKATDSVPKELKGLFNSLKGKNGEEFADDAYDGLVKYMGLGGIAPEKVNLTNKDDILGVVVTGGFYPYENSIKYSKGFTKILTKKQQFNMLSHELKHCEQFNKIIRTEGLGIEGLAGILSENACNNKSFFDGVSKADLKKEIIPELEKKYAKTLSLPKFAPDSPEGLQAEKYAEAFKKYDIRYGSKEYRNNLLEQEAYKYGSMMGRTFNSVQSPAVSAKDYLRAEIEAMKMLKKMLEEILKN